jgi:hypothetical protein
MGNVDKFPTIVTFADQKLHYNYPKKVTIIVGILSHFPYELPCVNVFISPCEML